MAAVYYDNKPFDLYNLGNDYPVSGYGHASALKLVPKSVDGKEPGSLDYVVSAWVWELDTSACPSGRFATQNGIYDNVSGTELPFLYPSGVYAVTPVSGATDTFTFPEAMVDKTIDTILDGGDEN